MNYSYLTRKQANIIYSAYKQGKLDIKKSIVNKVYDIVGDTRDASVSGGLEVIQFRFACERAIQAIFDGEYQIASEILQGKKWYKNSVEIGRKDPTEEDIMWATAFEIEPEGDPIFEDRWELVD